jgi:uncharacterized membrane protein YecN with MAPEG domain
MKWLIVGLMIAIFIIQVRLVGVSLSEPVEWRDSTWQNTFVLTICMSVANVWVLWRYLEIKRDAKPRSAREL